MQFEIRILERKESAFHQCSTALLAPPTHATLVLLCPFQTDRRNVEMIEMGDHVSYDLAEFSGAKNRARGQLQVLRYAELGAGRGLVEGIYECNREDRGRSFPARAAWSWIVGLDRCPRGSVPFRAAHGPQQEVW